MIRCGWPERVNDTANPIGHPGYRRDIDGLRAIAVLSVVGFHAFPQLYPGGFIGVDIFFVISGFLISTIILAKLAAGNFSFVDFYVRRARRIFPALLAVLVALVVAGWFLSLAGEYRLIGKHVATAALFASNFTLWAEVDYFDISASVKPLLHLWSLGVEEQFYLLWPLLLLLSFRGKFLWRTMGILAVGSFAYSLYATFHSPTAAFFSPASRWWELMIGGVLAQLVLRHGTLRGLPAALCSLAGIALIGIAFGFLDEHQPFPGWWALAPTLGTFMVVIAGPEAWLNRLVLSNRLLVGCGLISYPLYLWHWPLFSLTRLWRGGLSPAIGIAEIAAAVLLAWLTYEFIEKPVRRASRPGRTALALSACLAGVGALGAGISLAHGFVGRTIVGQARPPFVASNIDPQHRPCAKSDGLPEVLKAVCYSHLNPSAKPRVVVWGDSYGEVWAPVFETLARREGFELVLVQVPGCPPIVGIRRSQDARDPESGCNRRDVQDARFDAILRLKPDVVVLAARWSLYSEGFFRTGELQKESHYLTTAANGPATIETSRAALAQAIPATVDRLLEHNVKVLIIKPPPGLKSDVSNLRWSIAELQATPAERERTSRFTDDILGRMKGVDTIDIAALLCRESCPVEKDGRYLYIDDNHLGVFGARLFESGIDAALKRQLQGLPRPR